MTDKKLFSVDDCEKLSNHEVRELYKKYVNPAIERLFGSFDLGQERVDHAEGVWIYTKNNEKILDATGGIGVLSHGHNNSRILNTRIEFQKQKRMEVHKTIFSPYTAALSHNIAKLLPGDLDFSFFCNSGAEAVEGAIKLAYKFHEGNRKIILHSDTNEENLCLISNKSLEESAKFGSIAAGEIISHYGTRAEKQLSNLI